MANKGIDAPGAWLRRRTAGRHGGARRVLTALALATAAACSHPPPPAAEPGPVVLIVVDTLRADHLPCYGYARPTAPSMCALADNGVLFERAFTPRTQTTPAIASMLTGLYPHRHGVRRLYALLPEEMTTLAELLNPHGYRSGAFISSFVMVRDFSGFAQGFEVYDDFVQTRESFRENYERPAKDTVDAALTWLAAAGPRVFLFLHLIEPHGPYTPREPYLQRFALPPGGAEVPLDLVFPYQRIPGVRFADEWIGRYDGEIATADEQIGRLFAALRERGWYDTATIVLVGDHGESMGEEGRWFEHGRTAGDHEALVPLIVKFAGSTPSAQHERVADPVSVLDVFPTVLAAAGVPPPAATTGVDLAQVAAVGRRPAPLPVTEMASYGADGRVARVLVAAHGPSCTVHWSFDTPDDGRLPPPAAGSPDVAAAEVAIVPPDAGGACRGAVAAASTALLGDLLTFAQVVPVTFRDDIREAGKRDAFIARRGRRSVPLREHEREALRQLGYLD